MLSTQQKRKLNLALTSSPYRYYFFLVFVGYIAFNAIVNETTIVSPFKTYTLDFLIPWTIANVLVALLVALNVNLISMKIKEMRSISGETGFAAIGAFIGLMGGACPGCIAGFTPAILGLFSAGLTINGLPLHGLELSLFSIVTLLISAFYLSKNIVCKVK